MTHPPPLKKSRRMMDLLVLIGLLATAAFLFFAFFHADEDLRETSLNGKPFWDEVYRSSTWPTTEAVIFKRLMFNGRVTPSYGRSASTTVKGVREYIYFYPFNGNWYRKDAVLSFYPGNVSQVVQELKDPRVAALEKRLRLASSPKEQEELRLELLVLVNQKSGPQQLKRLTDNGCLEATESDKIKQCIEQAKESGALVYTTIRVNPDNPQDSIIEF